MKFTLVIETENLQAEDALDLDACIEEYKSKDIKVVLDFSKVNHICVAGIGVIAAAARECRKVILKGVQPNVLHKFDTVGLTSLDTIRVR